MRSSVVTNLLDPIHDARGVRWTRGRGALEEVFLRTDDTQPTEDWMRSPFFFLVGEPSAVNAPASGRDLSAG